jgi:DNA-binding CsgD family transcriptional regulator
MGPPAMTMDRLARTASEGFHASILDHLTVPVMIVERRGALIYSNKAADCLTADKSLVAVNDDILSFVCRSDDARIKSAIADACATRNGHAVGLGEDHLHPIVAIVLPFDDGQFAGVEGALVLLSNPTGVSNALFDLLRHEFHLSLTEAKIAAALSTGADLKEVAHERGVSLNTLRTQLASIMEKTGIHRQAALVALVARIKTLL